MPSLVAAQQVRVPGILRRMGDKPEDSGPSLELPSLFGRRKKQPRRTATPAPEPAVPEPAPEPEAAPKQESSTQAESENPVVRPVIPDLAVAEPERTVVEAEVTEPALPEETEAREFKLPRIPGRLAAVVTGIIVGGLGAALTYAALQGCQSVRGTDSCGGPGIFVLLVMLLVMIFAGGALLAAWDVTDPKSTSALGVGLLCVIVLVALLQNLFDPWMFVIIPVVSALGYAIAHWVTTALVEDDGGS
jgi:hypothetical protein